MIADQIEQEVDAAVTSLQFGDLVAQLGISRAVTAANAASRGKPVVQHGMQTGEVELF